MLMMEESLSAGSCADCNQDLRFCKEPCRMYELESRQRECLLPCYSRSVLCLNQCTRETQFKLEHLEEEDRVTSD